MARLTQRDLVGVITRLRVIAKDLREASLGERIRNYEPPVVMARVDGLNRFSDSLEDAADELESLIPDRAVPALPD
jgi:hypothetical protein